MSGFRFPVRVYIEDTDAGGIVYYVNYLKYMERARSEWLRARGITQRELFESGVQLVVHRLECRYLSSARLDDALEVSADVLSAGRVRLQFEQQVTRHGEPLCEARVDIACIDARRHRPTPWPAPLAELLHPTSAQYQA
ncbi:tol-pal system-associated acyl-CoA thioesterase [Halomonas icarae]|uniref:Tol-pal system-associated acyl-CoA thioesterase n=1 Tax=Halomonas icarae TaxID=2691040 RepID=A0A7X5AKC1_9GAMM|nr:tol-pal system-associated acyl-CoA thioesterase [Halomonas icarae]MDR5902133.1 tol-pal system-associated acyl-CoA thioesterase [Halomonas icarae]NAW12167.1 tol-pal system-associated acyl-CoA thioesterase [Halomonas icarae]